MNKIPISKFKIMKVADIKEAVPFAVIADGDTVGYFQKEPVVVQADVPAPIPQVRMTKCPNCKLEYSVTEPDGQPFFFTMRHPKG